MIFVYWETMFFSVLFLWCMFNCPETIFWIVMIGSFVVEYCFRFFISSDLVLQNSFFQSWQVTTPGRKIPIFG
jgi:hypothetical protein